MKILIVDDDAIASRILTRALEQAGHEAVLARNGVEAWHLLQTQDIRIVLTDWMMPEMDGLDLCRRIRQRPAYPYIYIILVTSLESRDDRLAGLQSGADDFLSKPVDRAELIARLEVAARIMATHEALHDHTVRQEEMQRELANTNARLADTNRYLTRANRRFSMLFERLPVACFTFDACGTIQDWNPASEALYGIGAAEARTRTLWDLEGQTPPQTPIDMMVRQVFAGVPVEGIERAIDRPDGTQRFVLRNTFPLYGSDGMVERAVCAETDITESRHLTEQLLQSQKMEGIGRLAGGIAHDFNNLLTAILGYLELAERRVQSDSTMLGYLQHVRSAGERAANLTNQLLAFARKQIIEPRAVDLNEAITEIYRMLRRLIGEDVELVTVPGPGLWRARVDPGQLEQVLLNLVVNARDAIPNGGKIVIETRNAVLDVDDVRPHTGLTPGDYVELIVTDNGTGMDADVQSRIFEPFFTTKDQGDGTGLGLSICYGIIQQSGGCIGVSSEPGRGTSFRIYLPRADSATAAPSAHDETAPPANGTETVLLVEDEPLVRDMVASALRGRGYTVLEASGGGEALILAIEHVGEIDLMVTDVVMPHMSGPELAEKMGWTRPDMRVLFTSGYTDRSFTAGDLRSGHRFLQKPFAPTALVRCVRELLDAA